ncbi:5-methylcytosine-specific restriction endonuclease system specificity protein McrC [Anaerobutyricum soehngenii]|uniref:5-methylcytosine-specific restriction endonuclease system specificity protein McrC n=1 Tax=Anaerobutyricum soehngenii TaxID=105843 RepID=UPI001C10709F|nr:5-methylcytosine-specific restriction endonuclease system specificity protein McrC [Anaerobutyricum soehngenii]MBU5415779.1 5-methylcytosine-specific restriction endonuclease system specificity protein McrC [Anaerobutyricum soehngenii]
MIPIQNIYYMLSYAFQTLQAENYKDLATENFHNTAELCAAILDKGIGIQLKHGLRRDYVSKSESLSTLQGKLNISESIKTQTMLKKQMICTYDEFSTNIQFNQIIKSTVLLLLKANITNSRKKSLRKLLLFFSGVNEIDLHFVNWNQQYNRSNQSYQMLIGMCYLVYKGLLTTQNNGTTKLMDFFDGQRMCRLYEKFLLEYYRKEHPELTANASQIAWQLDDTENQMLPRMQTDIMLSKNNNILIIDAKYYSHMTQQQYGIHTLHSNNLYQIFTYVKNKEFELRNYEHTVSGMLLYAQTDEDIIPNNTYHMSGNQISVLALDLNQDFSKISRTLDDIAKNFL